MLYPEVGGFGGFAAGFVRGFDPDRIEVLTGLDDLHVEVEPGTHRVVWASGAGRRFESEHVFWAAAWPPLCELLDIPCQRTATDRVVLGSCTLDRPANSDYHEILVGDPNLHINRVSFPAKFRDSGDPLMQIEFAFPMAAEWSTDRDHWQHRWEADTRRLGILAADHRIVEFDFKSFPLHFNSFGAEGEPLRDADPTLLRADSNVRPVVPSMANLNLNAYVPQVVSYVTSVLAE